MVYDPNANWSAEIVNAVQNPIWYVEFDDDSTYIYSTGEVVDHDTAFNKQILSVPRGGSSSATQITGWRSTSRVQFELYDIDGFVTEQIVQTQRDAPAPIHDHVLNQIVRVYGGYAGLAKADYAIVAVGRVTGLEMLDDQTGYTFSLSDLEILLDKDIFTNATEEAPTVIEGNVINVFWSILTGTFSIAHPTFPLLYVSGSAPIYPDASAGVTGYDTPSDPERAYDADDSTSVYLDKLSGIEYSFPSTTESGRIRVTFSIGGNITYSGGSTSMFLSVDGGLSFELFAETSDQPEQNYHSRVLKAADMTEVRVRIVTSVDDGTFGFVHAVSLVQSQPTGLDIDAALIDQTELIAMRDTWRIDDRVRLVEGDAQVGTTYLQQEFFRTFSSLPKVTGDGLFSAMIDTLDVPTGSPPTLTDDDIIAVSGWTQDFANHLNSFTIFGDFDIDDQEGLTTLYDKQYAVDVADQSLTQETKSFTHTSRWLRSALNGSLIALELTSRLRQRYLVPPITVKVAVTMRKRNFEQGDFIFVTSALLQTIDGEGMGVTSVPARVIGISPNWSAGVLQVELQYAFESRRYGNWAPVGQADYLSASASERLAYLFISDDADQKMSNDDPGYSLL